MHTIAIIVYCRHISPHARSTARYTGHHEETARRNASSWNPALTLPHYAHPYPRCPQSHQMDCNFRLTSSRRISSVYTLTLTYPQYLYPYPNTHRIDWNLQVTSSWFTPSILFLQWPPIESRYHHLKSVWCDPKFWMWGVPRHKSATWSNGSISQIRNECCTLTIFAP